MRGFKTLIGTAALTLGLALASAPAAQAGVSVGINLGVPPVCPYGYYETPPYACAPVGFYGPGYFFNGIFLGVGPWAGWGYGHGWGHHRFVEDGGGRYHGRGGEFANRSHYARGGGHPAMHRGPAGHAGAPHGAASHGRSGGHDNNEHR